MKMIKRLFKRWFEKDPSDCFIEVPADLCNDISKINHLSVKDIDDLIESNKNLLNVISCLNDVDRFDQTAMIITYNKTLKTVESTETLLKRLRFIVEESGYGFEPVIFDQMFVCGDCQQGVVGNPDVDNDVDVSLIGLIWKHDFCPKCGEKVDWRNYKKIWNGW